ncbi:MAG: 2-C-methyl-D-erythritol 4-phosphate cytidylyltransferase [Streptococcaceae bacterium]|jgi:2-C-methyl-D-erythritol 4-phosphate cytidylyltransferase|nr:2-C-methyl-D-erythritol 4-phosphate cytidylyltransferase [Streptococcaceae bacterium]
MNYEAVLLAAGNGKRMGAGKNKVLLKLGEKAVIQYSIDFFVNDEKCQHLIIVCSENEKEIISTFLPKEKKISLVIGGKERQDSVWAGLTYLSGESKNVLIHDGARPFVTQPMIDNLLETLSQSPAAIVGVPVIDTIKKVIDGVIIKTIPRNTLWRAQTPQAFHQDVLVTVHQKALEESFLGTDDVSLVERFLPEIHGKMIMGSYANIKLTTPEDLIEAQAILENEK